MGETAAKNAAKEALKIIIIKKCYPTALLGKSGAFSDLAVQVFGLVGLSHCPRRDGSKI